ncbi:MAG: TlpA disulfide reductase family protein [Thermodesulfobacteriota bacterium]|nr:TlpA disulfide reductase family protein [Thermodesulfobacteriota bacterium]
MKDNVPICFRAHCIHISIIILMMVLSTSSSFALKKKIIHSGQPFPEVTLPIPGNNQDRTYLGLTHTGKFTPKQIQTEVLLIEFFNIHCPHCIEQVPSYNKLFHHIKEKSNGEVTLKMISIAVGNLQQEVDAFRAQHNIPFPVFADTNFNAWRAIGGKASPFSVFIRQGKNNPGIVCATHLGTNHSYRNVYSQMVDILELTPTEITRFAQKTIDETPPKPELFSPAILKEETYDAFRRLGRVKGFTKIELINHEQVYKARIYKNRNPKHLFAQVVNRATACDVCHDIHFIYIFNLAGEIIDIIPLQLPKAGNKLWDKNDIKKLRERLIGRNLKQPQPFSPDIDAITSATISSAMIFDSIAQGKELMDELQRMNQLD